MSEVRETSAPSANPLHRVTRFAASKPRLALLCAILATAAVCCVLRETSRPGARPFAPLDRASANAPIDGPEEAYFAASSDSPEVTRRALERIADAVEARSRTLELSLWGLDSRSLLDKRLYTLDENDSLDLAYDITTAREITAGRWNYLMTDAVLRRFDERLRSEMTQDRFYAVEQALPFARALAAAVDELGMKKSAEIGSPVAGGVVERAKTFAERRYLLSQDELGGVVCAKIVGDRNAAANDLAQIALDVKDAEHGVTLDLDAQCVEKLARDRAARNAWTRAAILAVLTALLAAWGVLGTLKRAFAASLCACAAGVWGALAARLFCEPFSIAHVGATACALGFAYYWIFSRITRYAALRSDDRAFDEALLEASEKQSGAMSFSALALAVVSLALLLASNGALREFGASAALCLPIAAVVSQLLSAGLLWFFEGSAAPAASEPLRIDDLARTVFKLRKLSISAACVVGAALAFGVQWADFDDDLHASTPDLERGLAKVELRGDRAAAISGRRALYVRSFFSDADELSRLRGQYSEEKTFRLDDLPARLPDASIAKERAIELVDDMTRNLPLELGEAAIPPQESLVDALTRAIDAVDRCQCVCVDEDKRVALLERLLVAETRVESLTPGEYRARIDAFQSLVAVETLKRLFALRALSNPEKPTVADLSDEIRARYLADPDSGRSALFVYSTQDLRRLQALKAYADNARGVDPSALGNATSLFDNITKGQTEGMIALAAVFAALLAILARRARSWKDAVKLWAPCAFALLAAFGALGWTNEPLEFADLILGCAAACAALCLAADRESGNACDDRTCVDAIVAWTLVVLAASFGLASCGVPGWARCGQFWALAALGLCLAAAIGVKREQSDSEQ